MISITFKKPFYIIEYQNSVDTLYLGFDSMGYFSTEHIEIAHVFTTLEQVTIARDERASGGKIITIVGYHALEVKK